ncbi:MAG: hypothetical protein IJS26_02660 [Alphaproteobacteria bacterium]|nr:hypothetical protein [Alphaproteobacteria bacterium]
MKYLSIALLLLALVVLSACDIKLRSTINLSDVFSSANKMVISDLMIDVSSCTEENIQKAVSGIEQNGVKAKYKSCKNEGMDSYAVFSMPLVIVKDGNEAPNKGDFYLSFKDDKLYIHTSDRMGGLLSTEEGKLKIGEINFELINDTEENIKLNVQSVFLDGQPVLSKIVDVAPYENVSIRLSDVTRKILERSNVALPVVKFVE